MNEWKKARLSRGCGRCAALGVTQEAGKCEPQDGCVLDVKKRMCIRWLVVTETLVAKVGEEACWMRFAAIECGSLKAVAQEKGAGRRGGHRNMGDQVL